MQDTPSLCPAVQELIFVSKKAVFKPPKAIRGGVPVCFPQFGGFGPLQQHGFARNSAFEVVAGGPDTVALVLSPDAEQLKLFPHAFRLKVTVRALLLATDVKFIRCVLGCEVRHCRYKLTSRQCMEFALDAQQVAAWRHGQGQSSCGATEALLIRYQHTLLTTSRF